MGALGEGAGESRGYGESPGGGGITSAPEFLEFFAIFDSENLIRNLTAAACQCELEREPYDFYLCISMPPGRLVLKGHGPIGGGAAGKIAGLKRARDAADSGSGSGGGASSAGSAALATTSTAPPDAAFEAALAAAAAAASLAPPSLLRSPGAGALQCSHTTVTGVGTRFKTDVKPGDVLELSPDLWAPVAFVVSDTGLSLKEPFQRPLGGAPAAFTIVRRAPAGGGGSGVLPLLDAADRARRELEGATGQSATSMTAKRSATVVGAKGSYEKVAVTGGEGMTREELLDLRCKTRGEKLLQ